MKNVAEQMSLSDLGMDCLKTSPVCSQAIKVRTSDVSSKKRQGSSRKMPLYLDLRKQAGHTADAYFLREGLSLGECMTLNTGGSRSEENESPYWQILTATPQERFCLTLNCGEQPREPMPTILSDILEERAEDKYSLSPRACQGILNRASRRGKQLPEILQKALEAQATE